jgi:hypothetical protein
LGVTLATADISGEENIWLSRVGGNGVEIRCSGQGSYVSLQLALKPETQYREVPALERCCGDCVKPNWTLNALSLACECTHCTAHRASCVSLRGGGLNMPRYTFNFLAHPA